MARTRIHHRVGRNKPSIKFIAFLFCALALILPPYLFVVWKNRRESVNQTPSDFYSTPEQTLPPTIPHVEIKHLWRTALNHSSFFVFDIYQAIFPTNYDPNHMDASLDIFNENTRVGEWRLILGEGVIPALNFTTRYTYESDLQCVFTNNAISLPKIQFLRYKQGQIDYRNRPNLPFSLLDAYMTHYILCPIPGQTADLIALRSPKANWEVNLFGVTPVPTQLGKNRLVLCLAPMYGSDNVRWAVEWLEYHRALGVDHVHVPLHDDESEAGPLWELLRYYHDSGFVTIHHWSEEASNGFTRPGRIYERAKNEAWNDCYLRTRGQSDWAVFIDIDEVLFTPSGELHEALSFCDEAFHANHSKVGCSLTSHTVTSVYKRVKPYSKSHKLLLDEYDFGEASPKCPFNCGKYHYGRSKYLARTRELWLPPLMLWTHAIGGQDYVYADKIMTQVPAEIMNVHHYQAWWYTHEDKLRPEYENKGGSPIPEHLITAISEALQSSPALLEMYLNSPRKLGVAWIEPLAD